LYKTRGIRNIIITIAFNIEAISSPIGISISLGELMVSDTNGNNLGP